MGAGRRGLGVEYRPEWAAKNLGRRREGYGGGGGGGYIESGRYVGNGGATKKRNCEAWNDILKKIAN